MVRMENSVEIKASPEKVWEMLALDRWPEWMDVAEVESAKYTSEVRTTGDKYKVGASAHIVEKRWEYELNVTESLKNEKLTVRSKGKYTYTMTYLLKPIEEGTKLMFSGDFVMPYGILGKALYKLLSGAAEKQVERALEKLKSIVEK